MALAGLARAGLASFCLPFDVSSIYSAGEKRTLLGCNLPPQISQEVFPEVTSQVEAPSLAS